MATEPQTVRWAGVRAAYDFSVFELHNTRWFDVGGIYIVTKVVNGRWYPVYIGKCSSFLSRLCAAHHKWAGWLIHQATHVHALVVRDEATRDAIERDLLAAFNTPLNEVLN